MAIFFYSVYVRTVAKMKEDCFLKFPSCNIPHGLIGTYV